MKWRCATPVWAERLPLTRDSHYLRNPRRRCPEQGADSPTGDLCSIENCFSALPAKPPRNRYIVLHTSYGEMLIRSWKDGVKLGGL